MDLNGYYLGSYGDPFYLTPWDETTGFIASIRKIIQLVRNSQGTNKKQIAN